MNALTAPLPDVDKTDAVAGPAHAACRTWKSCISRRNSSPTNATDCRAYRTTPMLVVLPRHIAQVQGVLRLCHERQVPVVARGAGTGLSGGALPLEKGVLLVMARFNQILQIDPAARTAQGAAGVRNSGDFPGGRAVRPILRARPFLANRLLHRRQRRRKRRRRALPEIRPDRAQHCSRSTSSPSTANT